MDLINLSQYEAKSFDEKPSGKGWVKYGNDNLYPQYLVNLYKCSATHNALCNSIAMMIFGQGLKSDSLDAKLKMQEWNLEDEIRKCCIDLKIQGGFALEIIYSIDRTTIAKVRHLPFENIRSGEVDDREECNYYYYSRDWSDKRCEPEEVHAFDPEKSKDFPTQVLYVKPFSIGSFYYPKPDYIGSINYIELDKEISTYHINNIKNGLAPSFTIHFKNGTPPIEERNRIRNDIEAQLAGATNAGKFIITYSDQPERKPDFEPFPLSDADKQYQFLSTETTDKIMVGHRVVSPAMFGVKTAGQLGSTQELEVASQLFDRQVVEPYQRIINKTLKSLFTAAGVTDIVLIGKAAPIVIEASQHSLNAPEEHPEVCLELASNWLTEQGEDMSDDYELIDERFVDYETEDQHDAAWMFARAITSTKDKDSKLDNDIVKVRYAYDPPSTSSDSRDFCKKMVSAAKVYRKEDIIAAGKKDVNKGWGPEGADTYNIFKYKGGGNCHHRWIRRTYLQKDNQMISVKKAQRIIAQLPYEERKKNKLPPNDPAIASQMPYTMPNNGFLKPR
tara:strand:+ start:21277 stop:22956 length:1680 start_codon:yes stop_codon:yes gene_type:complete